MVMGELATQTDVFVIGAGPGGYIAAIRAAQLGKQVTIVDRGEAGGTCLNEGCIPSKAIIYIANSVDHFKNAGSMGIIAHDMKVDIPKMQEWKNGVVKKLTTGIESIFKSYDIEFVKGTAFFETSNRAAVQTEKGTRAFEFKKAIISTGAQPHVLPGFEFDGQTIISSKESLELDKAPANLVIIGGGFIASEMGCAYNKLGSNVTIVEASDRIMMRFDADAVEVVYKKMLRKGINVMLNTKAVKLEKTAGGAIVTVSQKDRGEIKLNADKVLVATGVVPDTKDLRLQNTKVKLDAQGHIIIDKQCRTSDSSIFAVGDVTGSPKLAHRAYHQGKIVAEVIAGMKSAFDNRTIPNAVFCDPELAFAGMSENEAKASGRELAIGKFPFSASGRALTTNRPDGFAKVIADKQTGEILGIWIVGTHASNLISEASLAIEMGAVLEDLATTIHPHPTLSEVIGEAADAALGKCCHLPKQKK